MATNIGASVRSLITEWRERAQSEFDSACDEQGLARAQAIKECADELDVLMDGDEAEG